ncbi:hypothetical protein GGR56DRAFT_168868 [Xylariaceae sp. FL0804]|nr:hypothetical protein GGR56DRAFT_168868 [Xylariaceae sp. FL0804]
MDQGCPLRTTHDVSQSLQRKLEGLSDVERAFVHVDYDDAHDPHEEHKPLYDRKTTSTHESRSRRRTLRDVLPLFGKKRQAEVEEEEIVRET